MEIQLQGGCLCGAVRYTLTRAPNYVYFCHCRDCQLESGSPFVTDMNVDRDAVRIVGELTRYARTGDSGKSIHRHFCSRCGTTLKDAAVAKRKWWQKLIPQRKQKTLEAGARPWKTKDGKQKSARTNPLARMFLKLRPIVAAVLLLAGLVVGFSPNLREKVTGKIGDAKDSVESKLKPTYVPLAPIDIQVTSELPDQPGSNVIDTNPLTFWVAPGTDPQPTIVVTFDEPFNLEKIKLWNGAAVGYKDHERVSEIHFVFDTGQSFDLHVDDIPDGKEYDIKNGDGVRTVELHVTGTITSLTSEQLGLSEVEFYFKK